MNSCCWLGHRIIENSEKKDRLGRDSSLHVHLCLADHLISDGFNSLWGAAVHDHRRRANFLSHKKEHTGINAAHWAYRTAVRNKTLPWTRKQNDGVGQKTKEIAQVADLCQINCMFDTTLPSFEMSYRTSYSVNPEETVVCGAERGKPSFLPTPGASNFLLMLTRSEDLLENWDNVYHRNPFLVVVMLTQSAGLTLYSDHCDFCRRFCTSGKDVRTA